jgi:Fe-S cluster assembly iron-binding protein IscA
MLTLTESASTVVASIVDREPSATTGALRIAPGSAGANEFSVAVVPEPLPGDQVIESGGARVCLEPSAAVALDDKTLDAHVAESGAVTFALVAQT